MFERGKLVTSSVRAAAIVAGAVIFVPFFAFADSLPAIPDQISLAPSTPPLILVEGGKAADFVLTVQNISKPKNLIGIKNVSVVAVLMDGTDKSDTILPIPQPVSTCPKTITLAFGQKCTVTYTFTPVANGPKENLDSGITSVRFRADPTLGPMVFNDTEITVNDVGFSATPEPATLVLFSTGALCLTALARLRRRASANHLRPFCL
jgi:hypothetical protein